MKTARTMKITRLQSKVHTLPLWATLSPPAVAFAGGPATGLRLHAGGCWLPATHRAHRRWHFVCVELERLIALRKVIYIIISHLGLQRASKGAYPLHTNTTAGMVVPTPAITTNSLHTLNITHQQTGSPQEGWTIRNWERGLSKCLPRYLVLWWLHAHVFSAVFYCFGLFGLVCFVLFCFFVKICPEQGSWWLSIHSCWFNRPGTKDCEGIQQLPSPELTSLTSWPWLTPRGHHER